MLTRVLELIARPGHSRALCRVIEEDVRSILKATPGFMEQVTLISEGEPRLVVFLTVWRSRTAALQYEQELSPKIVEMLNGHLDSLPRERAFQFAQEGRHSAEHEERA